MPKTKREDEVVKLGREAWSKRVLILMFEKKQHSLEVYRQIKTKFPDITKFVPIALATLPPNSSVLAL